MQANGSFQGARCVPYLPCTCLLTRLEGRPVCCAESFCSLMGGDVWLKGSLPVQVNPYEDPESALIRELNEELSIEVRS